MSVPVWPLPELSVADVPEPSLRCHRATVFPSDVNEVAGVKPRLEVDLWSLWERRECF